MTTEQISGNVPQKPSRWATPKFYHCEHNGYNGCLRAAKIYYRPFDEIAGIKDTHGTEHSHNCCNQHEESDQ